MRAFAALLFALSFGAFAQSPQRGGELPAPLPLFPPDHWWNLDVSRAPADPNSAAFMAYVGLSRGMHPDFGGDSGDPSAPIYGLPYIVVSGSQPLVPVTFEYDDESDYAAPGRPPGYPIPEGEDAAEVDRRRPRRQRSRRRGRPAHAHRRPRPSHPL